MKKNLEKVTEVELEKKARKKGKGIVSCATPEGLELFKRFVKKNVNKGTDKITKKVAKKRTLKELNEDVDKLAEVCWRLATGCDCFKLIEEIKGV